MLTPGSSIGRYVVQRKLAEGGMAELYLCTARGPEGFAKDVVIKRIRSFLACDPSFVQMFISEARLVSRLNHANVVQIFDFDKHEDTYFIAMEYVRGASLAELKKRCAAARVAIPPTVAAEICAQVARGLHHAHTQTERGKPLDIVHRDVTPQNVLLGFDGAVKLVDFGIAKANSTATAPGVLKGKYAYMAPEQGRGEAVDARTDVFALGVVLWELLTGARLFDGDSDLAVMRAVQERAIPDPSRLNPAVPETLSAAVLRALARERRERFQTAAELERVLAECVLRGARTLEEARVDAFLRPLFPDAAEAGPPARSTGSAGLADTVRAGPRGPTPQSNAPAPTSPTASSAPTGPMPALEAAARTTQQPGLRESVPRLEAEARLVPAGADGDAGGPIPLAGEPERLTLDDRPLASTEQARTALHPRGGEGNDEAEAWATAPTASLRPSRTPAVDDLPPPGREAPPPTAPQPARSGWGVPAALLAAVAALGVAGAVLTQPAPRADAPAPAVVELPRPEPPSPAAAPPEATPEVASAAAPEPTRPPELPVAPGYLDIYARPFATVVVDGREVGDVTGHGLVPVKPGRHWVVLRHPRHQTEPTSVRVRSGAKARLDFAAPEN